jgi:hypothetical protein
VKPRVIDSLTDFKKDIVEASAGSGYSKRLPRLDEKILQLMDNQAVKSKSRMKITQAIAAASSKDKQP